MDLAKSGEKHVMKKILFILALTTAATTYAQNFPQKGSWYIGGSGGFSSGSTKQDTLVVKRNSWSFSPEFGTFLTDHIQLGFALTTAGGTNIPHSGLKVNSLQFGGNVYSRYFFGESDRAFKPFVGINVGYLAGVNRISGTKTSDIGTFNANLNAGFGYAISPRITIIGSVGMLGFNSNRAQPVNGVATVTNDFGFNVNTLGNRFTIGMYYTICNGKENK